jgi:hypothetical protein
MLLRLLKLRTAAPSGALAANSDPAVIVDAGSTPGQKSSASWRENVGPAQIDVEALTVGIDPSRRRAPSRAVSD